MRPFKIFHSVERRRRLVPTALTYQKASRTALGHKEDLGLALPGPPRELRVEALRLARAIAERA